MADTSLDTSDDLLAPGWQSRLGGLLGGPSESQLAPIVGADTFTNARSNGLLNLGIGMLQAGGPQNHKVSLGQAIGQGLSSAQQGYNDTLNTGLKSAQLAQSIAASRFSMQQKLLMMREGLKLLNGQSGQADAQANTPDATPANVQTSPVPMGQPQATPIGGGMPPQSPGMGAGAPPSGSPMPMPQQAPAGPQAAPTQAPQQAAPMQPPASTQGSGIDPAAIKRFMMFSGIVDPTNARGMAAALAPSLPNMSVAPDGSVIDLHDTRNLGQFHGKLADGMATLQNGVVTPRPGAADTTSMLAGAKQAGINQQTLEKGALDQFGNPLPATTTAQVIAGTQGGVPPIPSVPGMGGPQSTGSAGVPPLPPLPPNIGQGGATAPAPQASPTGGVYFAPPMGAKESADAMATANAKKYGDLQTQAGSSPDRVNTLDNILDLANGSTKFGPGTQGRLDNIAAINAKLPSQFQITGDAQKDAQIMQKYAAFLGGQYQKALGGKGSDLQLSTVLKGTPGPDMANAAIKEIVPKLKAQELAVQAKANGADAWVAAHNNNPATLNQYESIWRQNYDPRLFQAQQMPPTARKAFIQSQPDAADLIKKGQVAYQNGWIQ